MTRGDGTHDAVIVGAGPNGLAAAITLAQAGQSVLVVEANETIGGGCRSLDLTLPGFVHDICSAIHPLGVASPFFRDLPLKQYGLEWIDPPVALAHPFDDGTAGVMMRSLDATAELLQEDGKAWRDLFAPLVKDFEILANSLLGPFPKPRHPIALARFGLVALRSASGLARSRFRHDPARALFAGMAAHSMMPLHKPVTASFGLMLGLFAHVVGWPMARGGSQQIIDAMAAHLRALGGEIETDRRIERLDQLGSSERVLFDLTPRQVLGIAGNQLPRSYTRQLENFEYGPGVFKIDWALDGPVPWTAAACHDAGTIHLGGPLDEIVAAEKSVSKGVHPERPFVILAQQSRFDPTRAPEGKQTLWGYCHVPNGSTVDMTDRIEAQIERFAPGFRDLILARSTMGPAAMQAHNANYIGGDINGGLQSLRQLFTRPAVRLDPYSTPNPRLFICSSSTPPGGGVHGMGGYHAAKSVLKRSAVVDH
jgi:phytoene dehydrogenase-like protein